MKLSYTWLSDYIDHGKSPEELGDLLTMSGLELDGLVRVGSPLEGVVVGHVLSTREHPNADRLTLCEVDTGDGQPTQIVCGAPNVAADQKVPVATVGTFLPTPDGEKPFKIKKAKIRGEVSRGMICAEDELGLSDDHAGIMVLDADATVGQPFAAYLKERGLQTEDAVLDIAITPNRPDAISHLGVARDVSALTGAEVQRPAVELPAEGGAAADEIAIRIDAPEACPRYVGLVVRGVTVGESPTWLKQRLTAIGLRPINNVVDVTNYVMYECGQPLHAFDYDQIAGRQIVVRTSEPGERFTTLDSQERTLPDDTLLICDAERPVAIAGVMGGENSEVTDETTTLLIESAYFEPSGIRRTAKALGLQTDASYRFERGVDTEGQVWAAKRAADLIAELAGGTIVDGMVDAHPRPAERRTVSMRLRRCATILGVEVPTERAETLLTAIGFGVEVSEGDDGPVLQCTVPSFRPDVEREIDVIEEVARLYGLNNIPEPPRTAIPNFTPRPRPTTVLRERVEQVLMGYGYRETYTNSMLRTETAEQFNLPVLGAAEGDAVVTTLNPISQEMAALRPALLPGILPVMAHNRNHGQTTLRFFEFGHVYHRTERDGVLVHGFAEHGALVLALSGPAAPTSWATDDRATDFFDLKGAVEALLDVLRVPDVQMTPVHEATPVTAYHLEVSAGGERLGVIAQVAPALAETHDLEEPVYVAELDWDALVRLAAPRLAADYAPVSRFPVVERDLAVLVGKGQAAGTLAATIREQGGPLLQQVQVFDVYAGKGIPDGQKSLAFALRFGADRTLKDAEVDARIDAIVEALTETHGAQLRG